MTISNYAREQVALRLGSNTENFNAGFIAIGSASGTLTVTTTGLLHYWDRNQRTGSPNFTTAQRMTITADFNSTEMSGLTLRQFGAFALSSGGNAWQVENVIATVFDGTQELQVELTWSIF